jgi:hypothetical protein
MLITFEFERDDENYSHCGDYKNIKRILPGQAQCCRHRIKPVIKTVLGRMTSEEGQGDTCRL